MQAGPGTSRDFQREEVVAGRHAGTALGDNLRRRASEDAIERLPQLRGALEHAVFVEVVRIGPIQRARYVPGDGIHRSVATRISIGATRVHKHGVALLQVTQDKHCIHVHAVVDPGR